MPPGVAAPPHRPSRVVVADVDRTAARAVQLGAKQHVRPSDVLNIRRFAVHADPTGASFAIFKAARG